VTVLVSGCGDLRKPEPESYYARTAPPRKQEFRWSNGKLPKTLDPARAAVPPETDLVRAVYEGLTELDPATLEPLPAVAERWTATDDFRSWTFHLRSGARWSNGKSVTAQDFVRSWKRLGEFGESISHHDLLTNIVGFPFKRKGATTPSTELIPEASREPSTEPLPPPPPKAGMRSDDNTARAEGERPGPAPALFGVSAIDADTLQVMLVVPDRDLPRLVAHPIFRPVFGDGSEFAANPIGSGVVTNGSFQIAEVDQSGITLQRSETYWNRDAVKLERVKLVATENADQALTAYRDGELDAVTNVEFEPLALKLLEPFEDFRRRTHAAVNYYEINHERPPFDDRRIREALAISIERERLTEGEMQGLTRPALSFLPFGRNPEAALVQDKQRARDLLDDAGYPNGEGFPVIKLVVNRNETQVRLARAVARMWKQSLNVETDVVVKEAAEVEAARDTGDFDLIRRNAVFPSADELMSILTILTPPSVKPREESSPSTGPEVEAQDRPPANETNRNQPPKDDTSDVAITEVGAVYDLWAIPLYYPTSYSLVKPYVSGFEMNNIDAPMLQHVSIDSDWQPK
jgi:oligopeptide transport system substrate-binding protein